MSNPLQKLGSGFADMNPFKSKGNYSGQAEDELNAAKQRFSELETPTLTPQQVALADYQGVGKSSLNGVKLNPEYVKTQQEQLGALRSLADRGGRDGASDANLAAIQAKTNANARGQKEAILQNMAARGRAGSGASLLAQLSDSQNQTNNQSLQDMNVRGQDQQAALASRMGAGQLGSQMQQNDYNQQATRAQANDAIAKFNAQNRAQASLGNAQMRNQAQQYNTGLQQTAYQNQYNKAAGTSGVDLAGAKHYDTLADIDARRQGGMLSGALGVGSTILGSMGSGGAFAEGGALSGMFGGGGASAAAGGAAGAGAGAGIIDAGVGTASAGGSMYAAHGGKVPGIPDVPGNSFQNDKVHAMLSPGEVVVPRSLTNATSDVIGKFVHNPPEAHDPEREYKLAALKHLFGRR